MLNIVTIYSINKTATMPKTLKTLLLSLACSDVAVGLFIQPLYTFFLINWLRLDNLGCNTAQVRTILSRLFLTASFLSVVAVSVDRFLAVRLHLRYQELVTHRRVVVAMISIWVYSAFVSLITLWAPHRLHVEYCDNLFHTQNCNDAKNSENSAAKSCLLGCCCWFVYSTIIHFLFDQLASIRQSWL